MTDEPLETRMNRPSKETGIAIGHVIGGKYRVRKLLGEGATGRVFLAEMSSPGGKVPVAIKVHKGTKNFRRLEQEAKLALAIDHPNVCRMFAYGKLPDGRPYLVMEALLRGNSLHRLLSRVRMLDEQLTLSIAIQLLAGLEAVHRLGIVHRDIKPGNVFLVKSSGYPQVKLLDFGMAKPPPERAVVYTRPGYTFGTPGYMAPELLNGHPPTSRSDLWGVGVVVFELLAGVRPFRDASEGGSPYAVIVDPPRSLAACAPYVSRELVAIVETALDKDPRKRFSSAQQMRSALEQLLMAVPSAPAMTESGRLSGFDRSTDVSLPVLDTGPASSRSGGGSSSSSIRLYTEGDPASITITERVTDLTPPSGRSRT